MVAIYCEINGVTAYIPNQKFRRENFISHL